MKLNKYKIIICFALLLLTAVPNDSFSQGTKSSLKAGDQRKAEKGLKDNRFFFYFINSSISNFGTDEEKKLFKEAIERDMLSQFLYMSFDFKESFTEIRKVQSILIDLYRKVLRKDLDATIVLLNEIAPSVFLNENIKAKEYLRLGYRDKAVSEQFLLMADNYEPNHYSQRLYQYVRAIKLAKHGKRYAFLAMLEIKIPQEEKKSEHEYTFNELKEIIPKYSPENKKDLYSLIHLDNYYLTGVSDSLYDNIWDNPDYMKIQEYKKESEINQQLKQ